MTNDDGIESEGLHVLARTIAKAGHDTVVVAPNSDRSGVGAALGLVHADQHLDSRRVEVVDLDVPAYALDGPPGMCVVAARLGAFGDPPEMVVSGINAGLNTGRSILHSGTVGAALTAQNFGISGLAVSVDADRESGVWPWSMAADLAVEVLDRFADAPARTVINLNVPGRAPVLGVRWARLAAFGAARAAIAETPDGRLQFELQTTGATPAPDSDQGVVEAGYASITTIVGIAEAWPPGLDDATTMEARVVPGAPFAPVHTLPDASLPRWLHRPLAATNPVVPSEPEKAGPDGPPARQ
ncbi:MAG TPA: 5'/3'-nucleotidase SurE [Acidimicrobiia bacterium]